MKHVEELRLIGNQLSLQKPEGKWRGVCPAIVSGIVTGDAPVSYWPIVFPIASNSPTSLCETKIDPVSFSFLKWRVCWPVLFQTHASLFGFLPAQVQSQDQPEIKKDSKIINHSNFYSVQGKRKLSSILWPDCKVLFSWPLSHIPHGISEWKKDRSGWGAKLAR